MSFGPLGSNPIGSPRMLAIGPGAKPVRKIAFELRQRSKIAFELRQRSITIR